MRLNADFSQPAVIRPDDYEWVASPMPGVERMMLDRVGEEVARATSLVRYAANSAFSKHVHNGGEEFYVLAGEFADEHRTYPVGSYVRNPIGTAHTPKIGEQGCTIFVKLQQFEADDDAQFVVDTKTREWSAGVIPGLQVMNLHQYKHEHVALVKWAPHTRFNEHKHWGGEEIFVIEGTFFDEYGEYPAGTWIRNPHQSTHEPFTRADGALIYVKVGHLS
ncbi:MAG: cupin domain-containing protein [Proteobacteria bacterium]|nr:cupin domain-containing protein [Pseudomonadota bacterium]